MIENLSQYKMRLSAVGISGIFAVSSFSFQEYFSFFSLIKRISRKNQVLKRCFDSVKNLYWMRWRERKKINQDGAKEIRNFLRDFFFEISCKKWARIDFKNFLMGKVVFKLKSMGFALK